MGAHLHTSTIHGVSKVVALHSDLLEGSIFLVAEGQRVRFYSCCMCESTLLLRDFAPSSATEPLPSGGDGAGLVQSMLLFLFHITNLAIGRHGAPPRHSPDSALGPRPQVLSPPPLT